jgi:KUP system potassium uptake protein
MPALVLNYFGQGALLLEHPEAVKTRSDDAQLWHCRLWSDRPPWPRCCSQALISGAFSATKDRSAGLICRACKCFTPAFGKPGKSTFFINWALFAAIVMLWSVQVLRRLATAYGTHCSVRQHGHHHHPDVLCHPRLEDALWSCA